QDAFARNDFSFQTYRDYILTSPLLKELPIRIALARYLYSLRRPWQVWLTWRLARVIVQVMRRLSPRSVPFKTPKRVKLSV
ncbi:MAG: hypothetical protein AAF629_03450, partial [Chloroflexota bacterium]